MRTLVEKKKKTQTNASHQQVESELREYRSGVLNSKCDRGIRFLACCKEETKTEFGVRKRKTEQEDDSGRVILEKKKKKRKERRRTTVDMVSGSQVLSR